MYWCDVTNDYLDELGELALGSRLKRLSEKMMADAASVYRHFDIDVQPKWFTLLALLHEKGPVSVVQASEYLGLTQPAISQFCRQLSGAEYISVEAAKTDSRVRLMSLTTKGHKQIARMLPMWVAVDKAAKELCTEFENDFYQSLRKFELALAKRTLKQRTIENYNE